MRLGLFIYYWIGFDSFQLFNINWLMIALDLIHFDYFWCWRLEWNISMKWRENAARNNENDWVVVEPRGVVALLIIILKWCCCCCCCCCCCLRLRWRWPLSINGWISFFSRFTAHLLSIFSYCYSISFSLNILLLLLLLLLLFPLSSSDARPPPPKKMNFHQLLGISNMNFDGNSSVYSSF